MTDAADRWTASEPAIERPGLYIFDLDGVIYRGDAVLPFAADALNALRRSGAITFFLTNNSTRTRESYAQKLTSMGIPTSIEHIMTSAYAAALYFKEQHLTGATAYVIGEEGIVVELTRVGVRVVQGDAPVDKIDAVVVGLDRAFSYDKLCRAQQAIREGAIFIATNADLTFPLEAGRVIPGGGALVAAVQAATSVAPVMIGKPEPYTAQKILEMTGVPPAQTTIVGDRLDTDMLQGRRMGLRTVLVLTGITTREEALRAPEEMRPDIIIDNLSQLPGLQ